MYIFINTFAQEDELGGEIEVHADLVLSSPTLKGLLSLIKQNGIKNPVEVIFNGTVIKSCPKNEGFEVANLPYDVIQETFINLVFIPGAVLKAKSNTILWSRGEKVSLKEDSEGLLIVSQTSGLKIPVTCLNKPLKDLFSLC